MPERKIILAVTQANYDAVAELLSQGWILDTRMYNGRPMRLQAATVYHLIKFSDEELAAMAKEKELEPQILSVKRVSHDEVDALIEQGYTVKDTYAKDVVLVKTGVKEKTAAPQEQGATERDA